MLSSLQTAIAQLHESVTAVLVMMADQPMIEPAHIDRLLEAYWQGRGALIAPSFEGRRGNPVLIGRPYFDELLALPPDSAPRHLVKRHQDMLHLVEIPTTAVLQDLDNPEDYARWRP
jgi:molybdenum cofactor cytidylyltransferase